MKCLAHARNGDADVHKKINKSKNRNLLKEKTGCHSTAAGIAAADKSHQTRPDKTALLVVVVVLSSVVDGLSAYEIFC